MSKPTALDPTMDRFVAILLLPREDDPSRFTFFSDTDVDDGISVDPDGNITITGSQPTSIEFRLDQASPNTEFTGLQLGWFGTAIVDSHGSNVPLPRLPRGHRMPEKLPYRLRSETADDGRVVSLTLEDTGAPGCDVISYQLFLHDRATGRTITYDPKIYNEGIGGNDDEPPLEPGNSY